jgi:hypothetical protein
MKNCRIFCHCRRGENDCGNREINANKVRFHVSVAAFSISFITRTFDCNKIFVSKSARRQWFLPQVGFRIRRLTFGWAQS